MGPSERRTKEEIIDEIMKILSKGPASVNEISEKIDANWSTVENSLNLLDKLGVVRGEKGGNRWIFTLTGLSESKPIEEDTLFGIPIDEEERGYSCYLFKQIKERYHEKKGQYPNKTFAQKMAVDVANSLKLPVPRGLYLFGEVLLLQYDPSTDYSSCPSPSEHEKIDKITDYVVDNYMHFRNTREVIKHQYVNMENSLYVAKYKLQEMFDYYDLKNTHNKKVLQRRLYDFVFSLDAVKHDERSIEMANTFVSVVGRLVSSEDVNLNEPGIRRDILGAYEYVWNIIAAYNLIDSLSGDYGKYDRDQLMQYIEPKLEILYSMVDEYLCYLVDLYPTKPQEPEKKFDKLASLRGSIKAVKEVSPEERMKYFEEFARKTKTSGNIFRKSNLN